VHLLELAGENLPTKHDLPRIVYQPIKDLHELEPDQPIVYKSLKLGVLTALFLLISNH